MFPALPVGPFSRFNYLSVNDCDDKKPTVHVICCALSFPQITLSHVGSMPFIPASCFYQHLTIEEASSGLDDRAAPGLQATGEWRE